MEYKRACIQSFSTTTRGKAIQKTALPTSREITIMEDLAKFQQMFVQAMHHAMIKQSSILMYSVQNAIHQMMAGNFQTGYNGI